ncbi:hypothetical protein AFK68_16570 [Hydrocoleum sp. CS-953]|uniref:ATP-binding protein n=1 Tax=Hydrocoleum sp. CS-953 TaxID=1671698 RepID=UPI000B9C32C7|nr:ATP-binding protein [Hydrocoleum sp. CS-953]OZH53598.1 hypothetical protein AFK68_16570 [Hydrocoleum sp. CS-953]
MGFKADRQGVEKIRQAMQEKGWQWDASTNDAPLIEASKILEPNEQKWPREYQGKIIYAQGCSNENWQRFLKGISIGNEAFKAFCQALELDWENIVDPTSNNQLQKRQERAKFLEYFWVGREQLINQLTAKLKENCRLLVLTGITGIGKTSLGYQLVKVLEIEGFQRSKPLDFENDDTTKDFTSVAAELLIKWHEKVTPDERKQPEILLNRLLYKLVNNPYLLQIESLEILLEGNKDTGWNNFRDEYQGEFWVKFFQKLLAAPECQSRIIVTSQHFPTQSQEWGYAEHWCCHLLEGLEEFEQLGLFEKTGIEVEAVSPNQLYLKRIGAAYEGHPLALLVIAGEIMSESFFGDVVAYWEKWGHEIKKIEKAQQQEKIESEKDNFRLQRYTKDLRQLVEKRIGMTFQRLLDDFPDAYKLLCFGAVYRRGVPQEAWNKGLKYGEEYLQDMMDVLFDRYLVEIGETGYMDVEEVVRQHNLIRSVALTQLKKCKNRR